MEPKEIDINATHISIRLMDESYTMGDDEERARVVIDVECRSMSPRWPNPLYSVYYRKILKTYGFGPVLAWQGRRIVGFLPVIVPGCGIPELPLCVHYTGGSGYGAEKHINLAMIENAMETPFEQLSNREIRIGCMSIHRNIRGRGLAASMIQYMADWARGNDWDRMRARVMLDGEPQAFYPTSSWWMGLGFKTIGTVRSFGPTKSAIDRSKAVDRMLDLREYDT